MHFIPNIISIKLYNIFSLSGIWTTYTRPVSFYHLLRYILPHWVPLKKGGELGGKSIPLTYMNYTVCHSYTYIHTHTALCCSQVSKLNVTNTCACMCTGFYVSCGVVHNKHTLSWPSKIILPGSTVLLMPLNPILYGVFMTVCTVRAARVYVMCDDVGFTFII